MCNNFSHFSTRKLADQMNSVPVLEDRKRSPLLLQSQLLVAVEGRHARSICVSIAIERDAKCTRLPFAWPEECSHRSCCDAHDRGCCVSLQ